MNSRDNLQPLYVTATRIDEVHDSAPNDAKNSRIYSYLRKLSQDAVFRTSITNAMYIALWYILSTTLSLFNKKVVGKEHGLFGRGAFPVLPNGVVTGIDISFSIKSLVFISMSFYTMCKSTTPVFLLLFAFIWKIERPSWGLAGVVALIVAGLMLLVAGEMSHQHFDIYGFSLVMLASCFAGMRFTLTQLLLHGTHEHGSLGGPLEVMEHLTPVMSTFVLLISIFWEQLWVTLPASPYFASLAHTTLTFGIISVGAMIAFLMVWAEFKVIQQTSALTFIIVGTCKEVVTVIAAIIVMGDTFNAVNGMGLGIVMLGVALFNYIKYQKIRQGELLLPRNSGRGGFSALKEDDDDAEEQVAGGPNGAYQQVLDSPTRTMAKERAFTPRDHLLPLEALPMMKSGVHRP